MAEKLHVTLRKKLNNIVNKTLCRLFPVDLNPDPIKIENVQRILVVRVNYRIGNLLFITPLLNALEKKFPHAEIDVMIGAPFVTSLLEGMPQVRKVYAFPRALLKQPLKMLALKKELKHNHYDLLISPSLMSSSDSLMSFTVPSRYKVGFYSTDVFSPLTHGVLFPHELEHEALKPLALMSVFGEKVEDLLDTHLDLRISQEEKEAVAKEIGRDSIGIFRDARNEKKIENEWWLSLLEALEKRDVSLTFIDVLDPNNRVPLKEDMQTLSEKDLRVLAAKIANLKAFICGDTGPMHLASASGAATIALFKVTSPSLYGTLGKKDLSLVMQGKSITEIAEEILDHLKSVK